MHEINHDNLSMPKPVEGVGTFHIRENVVCNLSSHCLCAMAVLLQAFYYFLYRYTL